MKAVEVVSRLFDGVGVFDKVEGAKLALRHRLFVNGWELGRYLRKLKVGDKDELLRVKLFLVAFREGVPVGCAIVRDGELSRMFVVFVRKAYRRRGIGTRLYKRAVKVLKPNRPFASSEGIWDSDRFFWAMRKVK